MSILEFTRELCNPARLPCKESPSAVTVPFPVKEMLALIALISTSGPPFAFSFSFCFRKSR